MNVDTNTQEFKNQYILSSADNTLAILNLFLSESELSVAEIASRMNMGRTTAFRSIATLESRGFLTKNVHGKYRLGIKLFTLGQLAYSRVELISLVHPSLVKLADEFSETAHLSIYDGNISIIFIDKAVGNSTLRAEAADGARYNAHLTASGKSMLAYQKDQKLNHYIKKVDFKARTANSIDSAKRLLQALDEVREKGYAVDYEEYEEELTCYAVPILDVSRIAVAAISISGPTHRISKHKDAMIEKLRSAAENIGQQLS